MKLWICFPAVALVCLNFSPIKGQDPTPAAEAAAEGTIPPAAENSPGAAVPAATGAKTGVEKESGGTGETGDKYSSYGSEKHGICDSTNALKYDKTKCDAAQHNAKCYQCTGCKFVESWQNKDCFFPDKFTNATLYKGLIFHAVCAKIEGTTGINRYCHIINKLNDKGEPDLSGISLRTEDCTVNAGGTACFCKEDGCNGSEGLKGSALWSFGFAIFISLTSLATTV